MSRERGRFRKPIDPGALAFSTSLPVDRQLIREDLEGSIAHAAMLARKGIVPARAREAHRGGIEEDRPRRGGLWRHPAAAVRARGEPVGRGRRPHGRGSTPREPHRARPPACSIRPGAGTIRWRSTNASTCKRRIAEIREAIRKLQRAFLKQARRHRRSLVPGYTHLQRAQPILFAHHLLAYVAMLRTRRGTVSGLPVAGRPLPARRGRPLRHNVSGRPARRCAVARPERHRGRIPSTR